MEIFSLNEKKWGVEIMLGGGPHTLFYFFLLKRGRFFKVLSSLIKKKKITPHQIVFYLAKK